MRRGAFFARSLLLMAVFDRQDMDVEQTGASVYLAFGSERMS
jgi:hypothetical protein